MRLEHFVDTPIWLHTIRKHLTCNAFLCRLSRNKLMFQVQLKHLSERKHKRCTKPWGRVKRKENNKKETTFKARESKQFHLHNLHACIYNTNTHTSHHCSITSISASFQSSKPSLHQLFSLQPFSCICSSLLILPTYASCHSLTIIALLCLHVAGCLLET